MCIFNPLMKKSGLCFVLILMLLFCACEGMKTAEGKVADQYTGLPLDSVLCNVKTGKMTTFTDSSGHFSVHNPMASCVGGCKDITVEFSKYGYKTVNIENPEKDVVVYLEK